MTARGKPCPNCAAEIVYATTPNGGRIPCEPYPDPAGRIRVDILRRDLVVVAAGQPSSARTRRYERHACGPIGVRRPEHRPEQLALTPTEDA